MTKQQLRICDIAFPLEAVTQTFGILAVRGAGKSNTAAAMAEEMHAAGLPFVVIDPVGSWWGLRSGADGKSAGLPIPIFGGRHGDVALERTGGTLLADLVVEKRLTCVLDVSELSEGDKVRFLTDFAERLYAKNTEPLHLFLEEADDFIPQSPIGGTKGPMARLLGAWQNIVRRGRARGLGCTLITQRSACLSKDVLTQIETLIVLRTTSPQDNKAIAAWVQYQGAAADMLKTLPNLESGEAWVWSPSWLRTFKRVRVRRRWTFDSGATPAHSKAKRAPATLADVDLGAIKLAMADTIERAKAEDPKALRAELGTARKRIAELEKPTAPKAEPKVPALSAKDRKTLERSLTQLEALAERFDRGAAGLVALGEGMRAHGIASLNAAKELRAALAPTAAFVTIPKGTRFVPGGSLQVDESRTERQGVTSACAVNNGPGDPEVGKGGLRRILVALAQRPQGMTNRQIGLRAGLSSQSGTFSTYMSRARQAGWVEDQGALRRITDAGVEALGSYDGLPEGEALQAHWLRELGQSGAARILAALIQSYPSPMTNAQIGEAAGIRAESGTFSTYMSRLRGLELLEGSRGSTRASAELFG